MSPMEGKTTLMRRAWTRTKLKMSKQFATRCSLKRPRKEALKGAKDVARYSQCLQLRGSNMVIMFVKSEIYTIVLTNLTNKSSLLRFFSFKPNASWISLQLNSKFMNNLIEKRD
jgi:hypothetical protein